VAYRETDSLNDWASGNAAFRRSWEWGYRLTHPNESPVRDRTGYTSMPGGRRERVDTLGGFGLAVSRSSAHPREAVALIRFLIARELRSKTDPSHPEPATPQLYDLPQILQAYARSSQPSQQSSRLVSRPSNVTGHSYEDVTQAYIKAVHSVLTGERSAPMAAAALEKQLVAITGFKTGPPKAWK
jgi:trehalose/maltose transport system substrate-binding protein